MSIQIEAAYHEASHAVLAHYSLYHALVGDINLLNYGAGQLDISLSKSKCIKNGKAPDASSITDKEVIKEFASILCAGLVGEIIASEKNPNVTPNSTCAIPDQTLAKQLLGNAGLSKKFDLHEQTARNIIEEKWDQVECLAQYLFKKKTAQPDEIIQVIENA
jgi:ATP-dependent Zn protease